MDHLIVPYSYTTESDKQSKCIILLQKKGVKPPSDMEVEFLEIQRAATRIELLVMEIISRVLQNKCM